jgi:hypothetical protein
MGVMMRSRSHALANLDAIDLRQHEIENDQIMPPGQRLLQADGTVARRVNAAVQILEVKGQQMREIGIIFD